MVFPATSFYRPLIRTAMVCWYKLTFLLLRLSNGQHIAWQKQHCLQVARPGWVIPDYLRERHCLVLGDSKELLPDLFKEHRKIDIFLHDSLHTFEHQWFEYSTAWPHLYDGGVLLSDDIFWSPAFHRFCKERNRTYVRIGAFGTVKK